MEGRAPASPARPVLEAYAAILRARGAVDFDDLVVRACDLLVTDAAQLRLVRLLAAPEDNLFVVGDDDDQP